MLPDDVFLKRHRMTKVQFELFRNRIEVDIKKNSTEMRVSICTCVRLALFLRYIGTGADFFCSGGSVQMRYFYCVAEVALAMITNLPAPKFPQNREILINECNKLRQNGPPGVIGTVDGCPIRIATLRSVNPADYHNYNKFKSIILLAVAGPKSEILWF